MTFWPKFEQMAKPRYLEPGDPVVLAGQRIAISGDFVRFELCECTHRDQRHVAGSCQKCECTEFRKTDKIYRGVKVREVVAQLPRVPEMLNGDSLTLTFTVNLTANAEELSVQAIG